MKRNIKTLNVYIDSQTKVELIKNTNALNQFFRNPEKLIVGNNIINVNHFDFNRLITSQLYGKAIIKEIINLKH